jgi:CDP-diacylglycerol--serine O-phosphatidyltransferase
MKQIPNLFTLLNLVFGCIAIVFILQTGQIVVIDNQPDPLVINLPEKFAWAPFFIFAAGVVDFLDGFVARLFKATSGMGKQLDSLADLVSFGVAPGLIFYQFLRLAFIKEDNGLDSSFAGLLPAFIVPCAAAWRLAKFNLDMEQAYAFKGVPTPAVGLVVASLPLIYWYSESQMVLNLLLNKWFLYALILLFSWLMVSNWRMMSLKFSDYTVKNNIPKIILAVLSIILLALLKWMAVPLIFILYIALSLAFKNKTA